MSPLWGLGNWFTDVLYTYRPSGAFYRWGKIPKPTGIGVNFIARHITSNLHHFSSEGNLWEYTFLEQRVKL